MLSKDDNDKKQCLATSMPHNDKKKLFFINKGFVLYLPMLFRIKQS